MVDVIDNVLEDVFKDDVEIAEEVEFVVDEVLVDTDVNEEIDVEFADALKVIMFIVAFDLNMKYIKKISKMNVIK
jgi:hypothetical protein